MHNNYFYGRWIINVFLFTREGEGEREIDRRTEKCIKIAYFLCHSFSVLYEPLLACYTKAVTILPRVVRIHLTWMSVMGRSVMFIDKYRSLCGFRFDHLISAIAKKVLRLEHMFISDHWSFTARWILTHVFQSRNLNTASIRLTYGHPKCTKL